MQASQPFQASRLRSLMSLQPPRRENGRYACDGGKGADTGFSVGIHPTVDLDNREGGGGGNKYVRLFVCLFV